MRFDDCNNNNNLESGQEGSNPSHQGTNRSVSNRRKKTDWATLIPLKREKPLAWDVTVPDTYAKSHLAETAESAGAAANKTAANKISKYSTLATTHHFVPISVQENIQNYTRTIWNTISFPKAGHITAEGKRTSIRKHILSRVIFVPGSASFQTTPNL